MYHRQIAATYPIRIAFLCAFWTCAGAEQVAAESTPYQARVIVAGAPVHSGPGDNFYLTDTLSQGDTVEVYRERPGGWLAIRPPAGSFSWVPERDLIVKDGGLAEVAEEDVASRIGSRVNDRHNAAQVRLKKGEAVEILGEENIGSEKWYKIAPPVGEFRWIQAAVVERSGPIKDKDSGASPTTKPAATEPNEIQLTSATTVVPETPKSDSGAPPPLPLKKTADPAASKTQNATAPAAGSTSPSAPEAKPAATAATALPDANQVPGDVSHELAAIELRLSRMAAAPVNLWNTERLERDTAQLMARAKTQSERDAIRVTQDKINRFAEIGRRANPTTSNVASDTRHLTPDTLHYDAVGILRPVVSRRPGAPQFALVDERGQVISFVTTTPDLNLQPYLGHRVGVTGNRGYIPEFQRSNVTAARVTPLNDRMVR